VTENIPLEQRNHALITYGCLSDNTKSRKYELPDALGEFHIDITDNTSGENDINASYHYCIRFLLPDWYLWFFIIEKVIHTLHTI
jgi:hypothetical protein